MPQLLAVTPRSAKTMAGQYDNSTWIVFPTGKDCPKAAPVARIRLKLWTSRTLRAHPPTLSIQSKVSPYPVPTP